MVEWTTVTLAQVCEKPQYGAIAKGTTKAEGPLFVRQTDITSGFIDWNSVPHCDLGASEIGRYSLKRGDLLISRLGNGVGNAAAVTETREDAVFAGYLVRFRPKARTVSSGYVGYQLRSPAWRQHVSSYRSGAAQPTLNAQQMGDFEFLLPPIAEQEAIAATLGALDDKIESNRRLIDLIPQLIRAQVDSEIEGAAEASVSSLASFVNGGAYTKGASGKGRMVLRIAELNSGPGGSTVYNDIEVPGDRTARAGDILMSWSGSLGVYRWFRDDAIINQHIFKVISTGYPAWLVYDRLDAVMPVFQGIAKDKATTMGHIQRGHLDSTAVPVPSEDSIRNLDQVLGPLWDRLLLAERENLALERARDALLPELLSGRIRVPVGAAT